MINRKHLGARNELMAVCWLLSAGWEVYRNVSQHGVADLVATREGEVRFIDVKANGNTRPTDDHINGGVWLMYPHEGDFFFTEPKERQIFNCVQCGKPLAKLRHRKFCDRRCEYDHEKLTRVRA